MTPQLEIAITFLFGLFVIIATSIAVGCFVAWGVFMIAHLVASTIDDRGRIRRRLADSRSRLLKPLSRPCNRFPAERATPVNHRMELHTHGCAEELAQLNALGAALRAEALDLQQFKNAPNFKLGLAE